jgi:hypothetical protein
VRRERKTEKTREIERKKEEEEEEDEENGREDERADGGDQQVHQDLIATTSVSTSVCSPRGNYQEAIM